MKKHLSTILLVAVFLVGLSLLLYPTLSNAVNSVTQSRVVTNYEQSVAQIAPQDYTNFLQAAQSYNQTLVGVPQNYELTDEARAAYNALLDPTGTGVMGYIEIPKIKVKLSIYHGVEADELQVGVGHIPGTSLPVGGVGTHCVLSGHRGLPSATLFTDIDRLNEGDEFTLHVLNEVLAYRVDQIRIVLPEEVDDLAIDPAADYCTLVTCTPYGINTHRLLVRGHRIDYNAPEETAVQVDADATEISSAAIIPVLMAPVLLVLLVLFLLKTRRKRR